MGALARWYSDMDATLTSGGTGSAYTVTTNNNHSALADQSVIIFRAHAASGANATLNVDSLGAKTIKKNHDINLAANDLEANQVVVVSYNSDDDSYELLSSTASSSTPIGACAPYAGSSEPAGWVFCDGSTYDASANTEFQPLFDVIGNTYGGSDNTDFQVPDLRGRVAAGKDNMNGSQGTGGGDADRLTSGSAASVDGDTLGAAGGVEEHQLTEAEMPSHTHDVDGQTGGVATGAIIDHVSPGSNRSPTQSTGGDSAHTNVQPTIVLNYIIKYL